MGVTDTSSLIYSALRALGERERESNGAMQKPVCARVLELRASARGSGRAKVQIDGVFEDLSYWFG